MTRLNRSTDCGNSPKNKVVEDIGIALEIRDCEYLSTILDSGAVWSYSRSMMTTAEQILDALIAQDKPVALTICHALCHGKVGTLNEVKVSNTFAISSNSPQRNAIESNESIPTVVEVVPAYNNHIKSAHFDRPMLVPRAAYVRRYIYE